MSKLPVVHMIALPILRGHNDLEDPISVLPDLTGVKVGTWIEDIDYRMFPMINLRRLGGVRNIDAPHLYGLSVIEMTVYGTEGEIETEEMYEDALEILYDAWLKQTPTPHGYLQSVKETMGATQFSSLFQDSWRIQGLIQLGVRPPRST